MAANSDLTANSMTNSHRSDSPTSRLSCREFHVSITRDNTNTLPSTIILIASGLDILQCLTDYARRCQHCLNVLGCHGVVSNVTMRPLPSSSNGPAVVTLHGNFRIVTLAGSVLPPTARPVGTDLTVNLLGQQGNFFGGNVVGDFVADGPVVVSATLYRNVPFN